jgi:hypothetical protein
MLIRSNHFSSSQNPITCTTSISRTVPANTTTKAAAADGTDTDWVAMSISSSESEPESKARPQRWQCCKCELYDALNRSFAGDEVCWHCGHEAYGDCASYDRVMEQPLGLYLEGEKTRLGVRIGEAAGSGLRWEERRVRKHSELRSALRTRS